MKLAHSTTIETRTKMKWTSLWKVRAGPSWALRSRLARQLTRATFADCGNCQKPLGITSSWAWSSTTLRTPSHSAITCSLRQSLACGDKQPSNIELFCQPNILQSRTHTSESFALTPLQLEATAVLY